MQQTADLRVGRLTRVTSMSLLQRGELVSKAERSGGKRGDDFETMKLACMQFDKFQLGWRLAMSFHTLYG